MLHRCSFRTNSQGHRAPRRYLLSVVPTAAVGLAAVVGLVTGCGPSESAESAPITPSEASTSTAQSSAAPAAEGIGLPVLPAPGNAVPGEVAFDPCFEVEDALIDRVGFDPGSRQRQAAEITGSSLLTKIGCSFRRYSMVDGEKMPILSLNITTSTESVTDVGADKDHEVFDSAPINRRPAVVYRVTGTTLPACDAVVEAPDGTFGVTLTAAPAADAPDPCGEIREAATVLASALDE
ncbi:DUF3558 domain-containing protein [Nocardia sp. NPDC002869]|uniref:DUF3558 domain-containing protein n=1 Tax=Nocardia sp. NPDC002869 TaxID=3161032 RepID=UPI00398D2812